MEALKRANDIRTARAKLKKDLKASRASIHAILLDPPEYVMTAKVFDMLLAVPKYGRVKTNRILNQCRISPSKTIGGLSERQRTELVSLCSAASRFDRPTRKDPPPMNGAEAKVFVITGPSGVGKGTLIKMLLDRVPNLALSVSATTREPREGEVDGRDYHFLTEEQFQERRDAGDFLEFAAYSGNHYGTLNSELDRCLAKGRSVVLEIEVQGAQQFDSPSPTRSRSSSPHRTRPFSANDCTRPRYRLRRGDRQTPPGRRAGARRPGRLRLPHRQRRSRQGRRRTGVDRPQINRRRFVGVCEGRAGTLRLKPSRS